MFGNRSKKVNEVSHGLQIERLKAIVGHSLPNFPPNSSDWWQFVGMSSGDLALRFGLTAKQGLVLSQTLLLMQEVRSGIVDPNRQKEAPRSPGEWALIPEIDRLRPLLSEHLLMFVVREDGSYKSHLLGRGTESRVECPDFRFLKKLYQELGGATFLLAHNHPHSTPHPSPDDVRLTEDLLAFAKASDMVFHDHIIVMREGGMYSMRNNGFFGADDAGN